VYKKLDSPPLQVKPIPILIIVYIVEQAYRSAGSDYERAVANMIVIAFFFLLRPGEYTGTASDETPFQLQDVNLYAQGRHLDVPTTSDADIGAAKSTSYTFTTQKNGHRSRKNGARIKWRLLVSVALSRQPFIVLDTTGRMVQNKLRYTDCSILSRHSSDRRQRQGCYGRLALRHDDQLQQYGNQCSLPMGRRRHGHAFWPHGSGPHTNYGSLDSI
jgi:hypothetical protein